MADPSVIWVVVDEDGEPRYISAIGDDGPDSMVVAGLSADLRKRGATLVRYVATPRADDVEGRCGRCGADIGQAGVLCFPCAGATSRAKGDAA